MERAERVGGRAVPARSSDAKGCGNLQGDEEIAGEKIRVEVAERRRDT